MRKLTVRSIAAVVFAMIAVPAWLTGASAAGAVYIDSCQTLSIRNTTYKLTADITDSSCGNCLVVGADRITIDLQGHSIIGTNCMSSNAISDHFFIAYDYVVIKNGTLSGYENGIYMPNSRRASVIGVESSGNIVYGIWTGNNSVITSSTMKNNGFDGIRVGDRSQVDRSVSEFNGGLGIRAGSNCLITHNTTNNNQQGISTLGKCTITHNTANDNVEFGIVAGGDSVFGTGNLVTHNTATGNTLGGGDIDYYIHCPSTVTFNKSGLGFPSAYFFSEPGCHATNNQ